MDYLASSIMTGVGATAVVDVWGLARKPLLGQPVPDYRLLGRWVGHMRYGRFRHDRMAAAAPIPDEGRIGWAVHYLTGIGFAALLVGAAGLEWVRHPTPGPALLTGIVTVAAPFLVMQPAMGAGIAARRTPNPAAARVQSLTTHAVFGVGLYLAGWVASLWVTT